MRIIYPNPVLRVAEEWLFSAACKSAARITIPSEGCKRDLINNYGIAAEAVKVIPNPIDNQAIEHLSSAPLEIETPHLNGRTLFLHVGRLVEQKNHRLLISACSLLRSRWDRFAVVCLGKGPLRDTIQSRIDDAGLKNHVFMLGEVQNPYPFMSQARALVLTSHFESFALVLVEAMACGAVPVAVDCPSGPREVLGNGKWGLLVPPGNAEALADAMWRIAHDEELYRALRDVGVERAQHYDVSRVVHAWETMLSEV